MGTSWHKHVPKTRKGDMVSKSSSFDVWTLEDLRLVTDNSKKSAHTASQYQLQTLGAYSEILLLLIRKLGFAPIQNALEIRQVCRLPLYLYTTKTQAVRVNIQSWTTPSCCTSTDQDSAGLCLFFSFSSSHSVHRDTMPVKVENAGTRAKTRQIYADF